MQSKHTGWTGPKILGHHIWTLLFSAYFFKMPKLIFWHTSILFILNPFLCSVFIKFIIQSGATWWKLTTWISFSTTCLPELVWTNCWMMGILKILWSMFNCAKNCSNWYGYFKDISTWMQWFCLIFKCKPKLLILLLGGITCVKTLFNIDLTDVFRTRSCWIVPKMT